MFLVSACLIGLNCKYNGKNNLNQDVLNFLKGHGIIPVCPEQLGGCSTPRPKTEIIKIVSENAEDTKRIVVTCEGEDVTEKFINGANEVLKIANLVGAKKALLKSKSPSCGKGNIYDGTFSSNLINGNGITAELLIKNGIEVISEKELE